MIIPTIHNILYLLIKLYSFWTEYATVGYMAKRIQMRKNRFMAIQKLAEQTKSTHETLGRGHSHQQQRSGHGNMSGHNTLTGHNTLPGHNTFSGHNTQSHGLSGHGLPPSHGTMTGHGGYDIQRHSHGGHGGHGGTLPSKILPGDMDHMHRQTVSVVPTSDFFFIYMLCYT